MDILIAVLYFSLFGALVYFVPAFRIRGLPKWLSLALFSLKVAAGTVLFFLYSVYYGERQDADVFKYYDDGKIIYNALSDSPVAYLKMVSGIHDDDPELKQYYQKMSFWYKKFNYELYNDNRTVIRFNAIVFLFSFGVYHVHTIVMSFLSFIGLLALFRAIEPFVPDRKLALVLAVFLVPSVLLWSSGVLKEGLLVFALGGLVYSVFNLANREKILVSLIILGGSLWLLSLSKIYVLFAIIPGLLSYYIARLSGLKAGLVFLFTHLFLFLSVLIVKYILPQYDVLSIIAAKQHDFIVLVSTLNGVGSEIKLPVLEPNLLSFIMNTPNALFNSFLRPHFGDIHSMIVIPSVFENLIILVVAVVSLIFYRKPEKKVVPVVLFCLSFVFILMLVVGLTTPVLGALVRYRMPALPFLFLVFILIVNKSKFLTFINILKFRLLKWKR